MKTKEEILSEIIQYPLDNPKFKAGNHKIVTVRDAMKAMQQYHDQFTSGETLEAVSVLEWLLKQSEDEKMYIYNGNVYYDEDTEGDQPLSAQQIINLFRQQTGKPTIDTLRVQQNAQLHYWRQRCEAAEAYAEHSMDSDQRKSREELIALYNNWQDIKQQSLTH